MQNLMCAAETSKYSLKMPIHTCRSETRRRSFARCVMVWNGLPSDYHMPADVVAKRTNYQVFQEALGCKLR